MGQPHFDRGGADQLTRVLLGAPGRALLGTDAVIPEQGHRPRP
jgi:hypothetical protein